MDLREACRPPLLVFGRNGGSRLRSAGIRRKKTSLLPSHFCHGMPVLKYFRTTQMHIINYAHKSAASTQKGYSPIAFLGLCKVMWIIEADLAAGQLLYITGDPVSLGCWDPEMAIPLSPSLGRANLWNAEIKVPFGIHFKYNYFIKEKDKPSNDVVWRPGPEFSISIPFPSKQSENITVRDLWLKKRIRNPMNSLWSSWILDKDPSSEILKLEGYQTSQIGEHTIQQSDRDNLIGEIFTNYSLTDNGNSHVGKNININGIDSGQSFSERDQPVEEPWLFGSVFSCIVDSSITSDASDHPKVAEAEIMEKESNKKQCLVPATEHQLVRIDDTVSTDILINSSVCTMQRIAILENGKLVELLLEPVKNNVQCDNVYLGVVTKLVPHMGGAFVDIGISRPSLMDIKQNREPFAYPPFKSKIRGQKTNGSIKRQSTENKDAEEHELDACVDENNQNINHDLLEVDQHGSMHDVFDDDEVADAIDISDSQESMSTETVDYDGSEVEMEADFEEKEHPIESNVTEDIQSSKVKWAHVRKGTKVIVQVVKEGLGTKGPSLTACPNLRSRFWILISRCNRIGVSKKITGVERTRLRVIAKTLQPSGFGVTIRTVAAGHSLEELQKDLEGLLCTWKGIVEHAKSAALAADDGVEGAVPVILHRAMGQTLSVVQDYFNDKVKNMFVDSPRTYHEVCNYLQEIAPDLCNRVVLYKKSTPIFDDYGLEEEIDNILCKRVLLSNGGSLVIEQTEALVSIDVNGGHSMLGQGTSQEKAVLDVNLAAAKQIARELRLRDIGGIIVVDFIDMADESNKRLVYEEIKKAVERDKSMVKVSELSRHGLMEITRKRVRPSVSFLISEPCICCHGTGRVEALETSFSKIEREILRMLATWNLKADPENAKSWPRFVLKVDRYMCNYLTAGKRTKLAILSSSLKVWILLKVARGFIRGEFEVKRFIDDKANNEDLVTISRLQSAEERSYIPNSKLTLFPIKKWKSRGR